MFAFEDPAATGLNLIFFLWLQKDIFPAGEYWDT